METSCQQARYRVSNAITNNNSSLFYFFYKLYALSNLASSMSHLRTHVTVLLDVRWNIVLFILILSSSLHECKYCRYCSGLLENSRCSALLLKQFYWFLFLLVSILCHLLFVVVNKQSWDGDRCWYGEWFVCAVAWLRVMIRRVKWTRPWRICAATRHTSPK